MRSRIIILFNHPRIRAARRRGYGASETDILTRSFSGPDVTVASAPVETGLRDDQDHHWMGPHPR